MSSCVPTRGAATGATQRDLGTARLAPRSYRVVFTLTSIAVALAVEPSCPEAAAAVVGGDPRATHDGLLIVDKDARWIALYREGRLIEGLCFRHALAPGASRDAQRGAVHGPKERRGDLRTPEGWYRTSDKPWSTFHGAIAVHYPNAQDAAEGLRAGRIDEARAAAIRSASRSGRKPDQTTALGGEILVHGGGSAADWTLGCIALDDADIDALRAAMPATMGTWVFIAP